MIPRTASQSRRSRTPLPHRPTPAAGPRSRGVVERGCRSDKAPQVARKQPYADPTACLLCGAMFHRKRWRRPVRLDSELITRARWDFCPACRQEDQGVFYGLVVLSGPWVGAHRDDILRRVGHVGERAEHTQPERRVLDVVEYGDRIEVRTTSQKLAHRVARELEKAFGGCTRYSWSDRDGRLRATWEA